ncbi:MAG: ROK family protein [Ruminococcaceae bacterium]|nr:ROK family protein [Oscillospiraceae bacterium]
MNICGIDVQIKNLPVLDTDFVPLLSFNKEFLKTAKKSVSVAVERSDGQISVLNTFVHGDPSMAEADAYYIDRAVKTMLWLKGGYKIYVNDEFCFKSLLKSYSKGGTREFDRAFMSDIYENEFEVIYTRDIPAEKDAPQKIGGHLDGCRIGFDAGGSDRKVSAVIDGETVYSEEIVWSPKTEKDPEYHYNGICEAFRTAASHMPRVDAVGISSAGVYINNRTMCASLFLAVPKDIYGNMVKNIYINAVKNSFGEIPFTVANDGDVSALAGAMSIEDTGVLGIAMGTSEAAGYVDTGGRITGWLNELAFVPVDSSPCAMVDEWSGDIGCGVKYFSQDAVIKLAPMAGIELRDGSPAEKLKEVQSLIETGDERAVLIYESIGTYLAHTLAYYYEFYGFRHVLLLGRVMSGKGGDLIYETCKKILKMEYMELCNKFDIRLPDERFRRVGQSVAAASLPETVKGR